jgi:hypothetical protein
MTKASSPIIYISRKTLIKVGEIFGEILLKKAGFR